MGIANLVGGFGRTKWISMTGQSGLVFEVLSVGSFGINFIEKTFFCL